MIIREISRRAYFDQTESCLFFYEAIIIYWLIEI